MESTTSIFDRSATTFDRHRALPAGVPEAIRATVWKSVRHQDQARVLDIGAGTGRIGKAFVEAHDLYVGVDASLAMLQEFHKRSRSAALIHADGESLPFSPHTFDLVMLMQVLSGAHNWRGLLNEARRILRPGGAVLVGHTTHASDGVDARMKKQLKIILEEVGVEWHEPKRERRQSLAWLESTATHTNRVTAASWIGERTPREFMIRHRTGARFSALPPAIQDEALQRLSAWAEETFGSLDAAHIEEFSFELDVFEY